MFLEVKENFDKFEVKIVPKLFLMKIKNDIEEFRVDLNCVDTIGLNKNYSNGNLECSKFDGLTISICSKSYTNMIFFKDMTSEKQIEKIINYYRFIEQEWMKAKQDQTLNLDSIKISDI